MPLLLPWGISRQSVLRRKAKCRQRVLEVNLFMLRLVPSCKQQPLADMLSFKLTTWLNSLLQRNKQSQKTLTDARTTTMPNLHRLLLHAAFVTHMSGLKERIACCWLSSLAPVRPWLCKVDVPDPAGFWIVGCSPQAAGHVA